MKNFTKNIVKIKHSAREIYAVSYLPINQEKYPIVIFSHGFNGTHADFIKNSEYLASNGVGAVCFDFCGGSIHSKSDCKTSEMTIFTEVEDLSAVVDEVYSWKKVNQEQVYLFGGSQGGFVSALVAEKFKEKVRGLLLLFPAFCIPDDWNARFPTIDSIPDTFELWGVTLGRKFFESIHGYQTFEQIGEFTNDVLIFHGDQDDIVGLEYGKRAAHLYTKARIEVFPGEGHGFSDKGNQKVMEMTLDFVKSHL